MVVDDLAVMDYGVEFQGHPMLQFKKCQLVEQLLDPAKRDLPKRQYKEPNIDLEQLPSVKKHLGTT